MTAPPPKFKRWIARLTLLVASTLVALCLLEGGLRAAGFSYIRYPEVIEFGWPDPGKLASDFVPHPTHLWVRKGYELELERELEMHPELVLMGCSCTLERTRASTARCRGATSLARPSRF